MNSRVCSHVDGVCLAGCQDGYIGKYCNNCKKRIKKKFNSGTKICKTYIYENISFKRARKATLVKTVPPFVQHIVRHADTQTDIVVVLLVIQGTDVPHVYLPNAMFFSFFNNMFRVVIVLI